MGGGGERRSPFQSRKVALLIKVSYRNPKNIFHQPTDSCHCKTSLLISRQVSFIYFFELRASSREIVLNSQNKMAIFLCDWLESIPTACLPKCRLKFPPAGLWDRTCLLRWSIKHPQLIHHLQVSTVATLGTEQALYGSLDSDKH